MLNINYLRSGMTNTLNKSPLVNNKLKKKDRLIEYLKLSQGFKEAHDYAIFKRT